MTCRPPQNDGELVPPRSPSEATTPCAACGLPGTHENPLTDFVHDQGCMIYLASGTCTCSRPGYLAHTYRCPVPVEGDMAPKVEWTREGQ